MKNRILFLAVGFFAVLSAIAQIKNVSPVFAEKKLNKKKVVVLDVRTTQEFNEGHLPKAVHIDVMDSVAFVQQINQLKKGKTYLLYCKSGRRSAKAATIMEQQGFRHIWNMEGGITSWKGTIKQ
ncbi:rhodanese-like domain-containing protein [Lacibacter sp. H375]|uniref:rhodanese-like domain-containing protein n=1 Tax=Lacibacter sp. H375 TaxID=3133424 RepID=UPI0030BA7A92